MAEAISIVGKIAWQGPPAPRRGFINVLSVYGYEVVTSAKRLVPGETVQIAHADADPDDATYAIGQRRKLTLVDELPPRSTLLFGKRTVPAAPVWYCQSSSPDGGGDAP